MAFSSCRRKHKHKHERVRHTHTHTRRKPSHGGSSGSPGRGCIANSPLNQSADTSTGCALNRCQCPPALFGTAAATRDHDSRARCADINHTPQICPNWPRYHNKRPPTLSLRGRQKGSPISPVTFNLHPAHSRRHCLLLLTTQCDATRCF